MDWTSKRTKISKSEFRSVLEFCIRGAVGRGEGGRREYARATAEEKNTKCTV